MVDTLFLVASVVTIVIGFISYMAIAPHVIPGRKSYNPIVLMRPPALFSDEIEGVEAEIDHIEKLSENSMLVTVNTGNRFLPKFRTIKVFDWEIEPMDKAQAMSGHDSPIWTRKKQNGTQRNNGQVPRENEIAAALHRLGGIYNKQYETGARFATQLLSTGKRTTETTAN